MMRGKLGRRALIALATFLFAAACGQTSHSQSAGAGATTGQTRDDAVVATVGEQVITMSELDQKLLTSNREVFQALYDARRDALSALVAEALLDKEAERRGVSREELLAEEVDSKVPAVTDADVESFFEQNQARLGGQTIEQIGGQIREFLDVRGKQEERARYIGTLRDDVDVAIALEPPRVPIQVADGERVRGPEDADITIIEYSDFQ